MWKNRKRIFLKTILVEEIKRIVKKIELTTKDIKLDGLQKFCKMNLVIKPSIF